MTMLKKFLHYTLLILILCANLAHAENQSIKIVFVGDIMLDDLPGKYIKDGNDPFASFSSLFKSADLTIGNLECVVGTTGIAEEKPYILRAHPRVLPLLKKYFSALSLANNHSGDFGPTAFAAMLDLLDTSGIKYFGGGRNLQEAYAPIIFDLKANVSPYWPITYFSPAVLRPLTIVPEAHGVKMIMCAKASGELAIYTKLTLSSPIRTGDGKMKSSPQPIKLHWHT